MGIMIDDLRYPTGRFTPVVPTDQVRRAAIEELAVTPRQMREAVTGLTDAQLDTPYREGGWTVRQLVHHVPDSHLNAYVRLKLALTEDSPTIKPYDEKAWAALPDARMPVEVSLSLLDAVHARWVALFRAMTLEQFARAFSHPEYPDGLLTLDWLLQQYAWHSRHHVAHITALRRREGW
jgi:uncharacterized damage-inducible protein DinB